MPKVRFRKAVGLIDIIVALLVLSVVVYSAYTLSASSITADMTTKQKTEAIMVAQNIMTRVLGKGVYAIKSERNGDKSLPNTIESALPLLDSDVLYPSNKTDMLYRVDVSNFVDEKGRQTMGLKEITVVVYYPRETMFYNNDSKSSDVTLRERSMDSVSFTTYKSTISYDKKTL